MIKISHTIISLFLLSTTPSAVADVILFDGRNAITYNRPVWKDRPVTEVVSEMLESDLECVTGVKPVVTETKDAKIKVYNLLTATPIELSSLEKAGIDINRIKNSKDGFIVKSSGSNLYIIGADDRGTAYGMLEVSRMSGVSPWIWWNDAIPAKKSRLTVAEDYETVQIPSVENRGIFLNDEDWSLQPWSWMTFEPGQNPGTIGAKTYKEIFKLLLRLRGNAIWPGMHGITTPFYFVDGAKEVADSCGIVIGTSHCEPLMRNNVGEWKEAERGPYNYITNRDSVKNYWIERLKEAGRYENMYTIGMRGIHDGHMEGVHTMEEKVSALQQVINDQRELLGEYVNPDVKTVPQVFVPYKEVLDIMDHGLKIPDDVTLMWCDDNYGYMTRLSDSIQQKRSGGAGVYYHLSYWGRPHDYMWLGTTQPGLIYSEMKAAYDHNARKVWIVNVHDMKTSSYLLELFLDMAWDINSVDGASIANHLQDWLCREFGNDAGTRLLPVMKEFYRLCAIRRPEHMGWTQVELSNRKAHPRGRSHVVDTEFSFSELDNEADRYLSDYHNIVKEVSDIETLVPEDSRDNYFAQVKYPLLCAAYMADKMLEAQRARSYASGQCDISLWQRDSLMLAACAKSMNAYFRIRQLTEYYNDSLAGGKWKHTMCMNPRDLCVFNPPVLPVGLTDSEIAAYIRTDVPESKSSDLRDCISMNAVDYTSATYSPAPIYMLGHSQEAVPLPKGQSLKYDVEIDTENTVTIITALIPTQPNDSGDIRVAIAIDNEAPQIVSYKEGGRTDTWKENVLRNQARIRTIHAIKSGKHTITITALDDHVILDQLMVDTKEDRKFYVIPTTLR